MIKTAKRVYDLHITVNRDVLDTDRIVSPWKVLYILNVQGEPHCIVSRKYIGPSPADEISDMVLSLENRGSPVLRTKIERHIDGLDLDDIEKTAIIEVHYKYRQRGIFEVNQEQVDELNVKKIALSFSETSRRLIVSARFDGLASYLKSRAPDKLPDFLEEEEREVVVYDDNRQLDSFWPIRNSFDPKLDFNEFPIWAIR
ncbi:MAG: hypothetical protein Q8R55_01185 [Candidatus Taylorbacteria bacterium]|nr:hypothetical protein [Candidatus Taylorbacteria bacterium]